MTSGPLFTLVVCRMGGMLALSPWWDSSVVPQRWRVALVFVLALLVTPAIGANAPDAATLPTGGLALAMAGLQEVGLGAVTGLALRLLWSAIAWGIQLIGPLSGLSLTEIFDPGTGESSPALGKLLHMTIAAAWLGVGGHRQVLVALLDTFLVSPPGTISLDGTALPLITDLLTRSCLAGIRAGAPLAAVLLAAWLVVVGVTRLAPRSAAWVWGASLATMLGLVGLSLTLGYMTWTFQDHFDTALDSVRHAWTQLADAAPPSRP